MKERRITIQQVYQALLTGAVLEVQDRRIDKDIAVIFQGDFQGVPAFYVIAVASLPAAIVSVAPFEAEAWEQAGNIMRRRKGRS